MCQWDVTHGRNRYARFNTTTSAGNTRVFNADSRRLAIIFGGETNASTQRANIYSGSSVGAATGNFIGSITYGTPILTLDIERYGTLVTGPFVLTNVDMTTVAVTEILSDEADRELSQIRN